MIPSDEIATLPARVFLTAVLAFLSAIARPATPLTAQIITEFNVKIPTRDGISLSADIYRPAGPERVPVVLIRTPYTKSTLDYASQGHWWAEQGYAFVVQDVRGRGDSGGVFYPLINEAVDGFDTLSWVGGQSWSSGRVGMLGTSYRGWTQVYAAGMHSPYLKAIIPMVTPPDPDRNFPITFGVPYLVSLPWLAMIDGHTLQDLSSVDMDGVYRTLPIASLARKMGRDLPAWDDWIAHPTHDAYWQQQSYQQKLIESAVPALHISGWYDTVQVGTTENFINITQRATDPQVRQQQHLLIGPWAHAVNAGRKLGKVDFGPESVIDLRGLQLRWFDRWLKQVNNGIDHESPVRIFIMGANRWADEKEWPIARTQYVKFYLHSKGHAPSSRGDGRLTTKSPAAEPPDHYNYDPTDPFPFLGDIADNNASWPGPDDYSAAEERPDVLVYTTEAFAEPTLVCGPLRVKLFASSSARDTDWTARVLDVSPDKSAAQLNHGIIRARFRKGNDQEALLEPGKVYDYDIDAWSTCMELQRGHSLRLEISSSAFPLFDRNLNTGGKLGTEAVPLIAHQAIFHDRERASYLLLPVVPPAR